MRTGSIVSWCGDREHAGEMENVPASLDFQDVKSGPDLSKVVIIDSMKMRVTKIDKGWNDFELIFFTFIVFLPSKYCILYKKKIF